MEHQKKFESCDDGELGEEYSDAVVHLFARKWDELGQFISISKIDPDFQRWVIRHIDASASDGDLKMVVRNASACKSHSKDIKICRSILSAEKSALIESVQNQP